MGQHVLPGNPPVALTLRRSGRARRISLRVSSLDGRVTLTLPHHVPEKEGLAFAEEKADWLRKNLKQQPDTFTVGLGNKLPVEGQFLKVSPGNGQRISRDEHSVYVPGSAATIPARLQGWLKVQARERLVQATDLYAAKLDRTYKRITLRDTRSRWGSCSNQGGLMYSWRLILAPADVLRYVAAHEVAHLVEMNHSPRFWSTVESVFPDFNTPRRWLRENGASLHRYRFEPTAQD